MRVGTKSVIGGAHCFLLHPFFVAWGWKRLFGFPWNPRLWFAFALHDIGYIGRGDMDGPEGEGHVVLGARIMGSLFGPAWEEASACGIPDTGAAGWACLSAGFAWRTRWRLHSRPHGSTCRWRGGPVNCRSIMARSRERQAGDNGFTVLEDQLVRSEVPADWLRGLQSYTLRWVARHRDQWTARGVTVEGEDVPSVETQAVGLR